MRREGLVGHLVQDVAHLVGPAADALGFRPDGLDGLDESGGAVRCNRERCPETWPEHIPKVLEPVLVALLVAQTEVDQGVAPVREDGPRGQNAFLKPGLLPQRLVDGVGEEVDDIVAGAVPLGVCLVFLLESLAEPAHTGSAEQRLTVSDPLEGVLDVPGGEPPDVQLQDDLLQDVGPLTHPPARARNGRVPPCPAAGGASPEGPLQRENRTRL